MGRRGPDASLLGSESVGAMGPDPALRCGPQSLAGNVVLSPVAFTV